MSKCTLLAGRSQTELLTKAAADSKVEVFYNFADDPLLSDQYASPWGSMRFGKLLEDLDALAGNIAFKHADDDICDTRLPVLVTASVDRIRLGPGVMITLDQNYVLSGRVTWVGRSSMQIRMELASLKDAVRKTLLHADFTFVARDSVTGKGHPINLLQVSTDEERRIFEDVQAAMERKKLTRKSASINSEDPGALDDPQEALAREVLEQGRLLEDMPGLAAGDAILHRQTKHTNTFMCYPQQRNTAGRVFGGFLMRQAFELAYSTAYKFAGVQPRFVEIGEVTFLKPVEVGDLVTLTGTVMLTYTKVRPQVHVEVIAAVLSPEQRSSEITNTFTFQFELRPSKTQVLPTSIKRVFPSTLGCARRTVAIMDRHQR